jgi:hypothetical protein
MKTMDGTATATTTTTSDESKKNTATAAAAVFHSWLEKEAIPLDQVTNFADAGGDDGSLFWKAITFVMKRPAFLYIIYYLVKQVKLYFETMRSSNKEGDKIALEL